MVETSRKRDSSETQNRRPTIGLLINHLTDNYHYLEWLGVNDAANDLGVNLLCFVGSSIHSLDPLNTPGNIIYEYVTPEIVDGIVITNSILTIDQDLNLFERYRSFPKATISMKLSGAPCIMADNECGFRDLLVHLIKDHGYRRLAYIGGQEDNLDAIQRYQTFREALAEYNIPFDPDLIATGKFYSIISGSEAVKLLIDHRKKSFDAIVVANDTMAIGVNAELRTRGIKVPNDIAITGFDDQYIARYLTPSLTTVRQLVYQHGRQALEILFQSLSGEIVPAEVLLPTEKVIRNSCGCFSNMVVQVLIPEIKKRPGKMINSDLWYNIILPEMVQALGPDYPPIKHDWVKLLVAAFLTDILNDSTVAFVQSLQAFLIKSVYLKLELNPWQNVVTRMQQYGLSVFSGRKVIIKAENLWHQARILIGQIAEQASGDSRFYMLLQLNDLYFFNNKFEMTYNLNQITTLLFRHLPRFGIKNCFLSLYEKDREPEDPLKWSRLIMAYNENGIIFIDPYGLKFPTAQIIPKSFLPTDKRVSFGVFPLYFGDEQLGIIIFDVSPTVYSVYEMIRGTISSVVKGALLVEQLAKKESQLNNQTTALIHINSELEQFATIVSNDLHEPLRIIIGYLNLIEKCYKGKLDPDADEFINFAVNGAHRMRNLVRDLLTYSHVGQLGKPFESIDMGAIMEQVRLNLKIAIEENQATVIQEPLPVIMGDSGQMIQLLQNLIGNAIKFHGEVSPIAHVSAELQGTVWLFKVSDNGIGLDRQYAERIFLIFQRLHTRQEYAGTGIGLSVCQKIVERHGGRIWVESEPGKGATFYFTLPKIQ